MESLIPLATAVCGTLAIVLAIKFILFLLPDSFRFTLQWLFCSAINFISEIVGRFFFGEPIYVSCVHFMLDDDYKKMNKKEIFQIIANTCISDLTLRLETKEDMHEVVKIMEKMSSKMSNKAFKRKRAQMIVTCEKLDKIIKEIEDAKKQ